MKVIVLEDYDYNINEQYYFKDQEIEVEELEGFNNSYAIYYNGGLDWIPKKLVKIID